VKYLCIDEQTAAAVRAGQPREAEAAEAARRLSGLGDPTRLRIALVLRAVGELCVGDTATLLGLPIALCSHHVRALAERGLAEKRRDGKLVRYRLTAEAEALLAAALPAAPRELGAPR
jgi:DNA-binding transcriptional ArsR family regulator